MSSNNPKWKIWIDTGGTFTDCLAISPDGVENRIKVLSSSCIRGKLVRKIDAYVYQFESSWNYDSRLLEGFTLRIQNSNLESKVLSINYLQNTITLKENLSPLTNVDFELTSHEEAPVLATRLATQTSLTDEFPELEMRLGTTKGTNALLERKGAKTLLLVTKGFKDLLKIGTQQRPHLFQLDIPENDVLYTQVIEVDERLDAKGNVIKQLDTSKLAKLATDYEAIAISLLHSYRNNQHEVKVKEELTTTDAEYISYSSELSQEVHYLRRTQTTLVNAYLSPILDRYLSGIKEKLGNNVKVMTSSGGLVTTANFRAKDSLLSGPAGGMTAATSLAEKYGITKVLTFDMGGTSTDTARIDTLPEIQYITKIDGIEMHNPTLSIETVAAGGGSICDFDGYTLQVGPESAGAVPGPACYGAGGPLTITDVNLLLGKIDPSFFEIPIHTKKAEEALLQIQLKIESVTGNLLDKTELLTGFEQIANEKMAEAIRRTSIAKGANPKEYTLIIFGGAGGLHGCQLAELMGIKNVIIPFDAGLFSATGMGAARESKILSRQLLLPWTEAKDALASWVNELEQKARFLFKQEGIEQCEIGFCSIFLRFMGQESTLEVPYSTNVSADFEKLYRIRYGYFPTDRAMEVESIRMMVRESGTATVVQLPPNELNTAIPLKKIRTFYREEIPVFDWNLLTEGNSIVGPALLANATSTSYIPAGCNLVIQENKDAVITHCGKQEATELKNSKEVDLELFTNRFQAIAEEMGTQLQRTAFSVNVKERLDFSCALLDSEGELLVNAPHIPVHLGSLGICARLVKEAISIGPGDVIITNHPKYGGSHLPDVTLLAGVFDKKNNCLGYVINRAHHAEIGGKRPGSMPPDAVNLAEEGVIITPQYLVKQNELQWEAMRQLFTQASYPTRSYAENEADISAALSSLRRGQEQLLELVSKYGLVEVKKYMQLIKRNATQQLHQALLPYYGTQLKAVEYLDDGYRIAVKIDLQPNLILFDFAGSSHVHPYNLNANISILFSAVLYVLRLLIGKDIPLNEGLMKNVEIKLPHNSFLNPEFPDDPMLCPAVVGGNTEVSQRLVNTLLKAFNVAACSQGTMNNFLFGNSKFGYYETIGGGAGAGEGFNGRSAVHQHMTNTRITDTEELERKYPVRIQEFAIRQNSGGKGKFEGGNGIIRAMEALEELEVTLIGQHRLFSPYGLAGGKKGKSSQQFLIKKSGSTTLLPGICSLTMQPGDKLRIETPGGGGYGEVE